MVWLTFYLELKSIRYVKSFGRILFAYYYFKQLKFLISQEKYIRICVSVHHKSTSQHQKHYIQP